MLRKPDFMGDSKRAPQMSMGGGAAAKRRQRQELSEEQK